MSAVSALYGAKSCEFEGGVGFPQWLERREDEENERVQERERRQGEAMTCEIVLRVPSFGPDFRDDHEELR